MAGVPRRRDSKGPKRHSGAIPNLPATAPGVALAAQSAPIVILVSPIRSSPGHFQARLESTDELLVGASRQPFVDSARVLINYGHDPNAVLLMKHSGSETVALRARLSKAARVGVEEGPHGPRFVAFRTGPKTRVAPPPIAPLVGAASDLAENNSLAGAPATRGAGDVG
jgi:hypothetical protein